MLARLPPWRIGCWMKRVLRVAAPRRSRRASAHCGLIVCPFSARRIGSRDAGESRHAPRRRSCSAGGPLRHVSRLWQIAVRQSRRARVP